MKRLLALLLVCLMALEPMAVCGAEASKPEQKVSVAGTEAAQAAEKEEKTGETSAATEPSAETEAETEPSAETEAETEPSAETEPAQETVPETTVAAEQEESLDTPVPLAKPDVTPPKLISVTVDKSKVEAPGWFYVIVEASDEGAGLNTDYCGDIEFTNFENKHYLHGSLAYNDRSGKYEGKIEIDEYEPSGEFYLSSVRLIDKAGNYIFYSSKKDEHSEGPYLPNEITVRVTSKNPGNADTVPPVLMSVTVDKREAVAPGWFYLIVEARDEGAGLNTDYCGDIEFTNSENRHYLHGSLAYNDRSGKYEGKIEIDEYEPGGEFYLSSVRLIDKAGNHIYYSSRKNEYPHEPYLPTEITVHVTNPEQTAVFHEEVPATCGKPGKKAHYRENDGRLFVMKNGVAVTVTEQDLLIPATGKHVYTNDQDTTCNVCGNVRAVPGTNAPMYRMYNPYTSEHLLCSNPDEVNQLKNSGWKLDGVAWSSAKKGTPVFRLYNPFDGSHLYTVNRAEIDKCLAVGWKMDGAVCFSAPAAAGIPIYRLFNPYAKAHYHLYSANQAEIRQLTARGWKLEGAAWFAAG